MAAQEKPGEVEREAASQDTAPGRAEFEGHCGGRELELAGLVWIFQHSKANTFATVDGYVRRRLRSFVLRCNKTR